MSETQASSPVENKTSTVAKEGVKKRKLNDISHPSHGDEPDSFARSLRRRLDPKQIQELVEILQDPSKCKNLNQQLEDSTVVQEDKYVGLIRGLEDNGDGDWSWLFKRPTSQDWDTTKCNKKALKLLWDLLDFFGTQIQSGERDLQTMFTHKAFAELVERIAKELNEDLDLPCSSERDSYNGLCLNSLVQTLLEHIGKKQAKQEKLFLEAMDKAYPVDFILSYYNYE